ncbi:uncharacterized protein LOC120277253 [Dioscorea cayenensis subsp. rotundata]|uniref:Uncharacterized protein LOC120277253 n=1 Tax=Dioscorea cayennensis subsp. rotundata TaxID=55577 RepID=A0AB40CMX8_DIOCR|nr:uncharacterized protein LOC120277253 [Dioscorea cayenensis subsp. rotundata]
MLRLEHDQSELVTLCCVGPGKQIEICDSARTMFVSSGCMNCDASLACTSCLVIVSKDLWKLVEKGFSEEGDATRINESLKKDAKAMYLIQRALDPRILVRIFEAKTAKEAWDIIKTEFQGDSDNSNIQLHALQREFDAVKMKHGESVQDFVSRILDISVHSIIEAKDLNTLTVEQLSGSLKNHEAILNIEGTHLEGEKALHAGRGSLHHFDGPNRGGRGRGRHPFRGRGRGLGRSIETGRTEPVHGAESSKNYKSVQCFICKKFGHVKAQCWYRNKEANIVKEEKEKGKEYEEVAFMAISEEPKTGGIWLIDSGCSNIMTGEKSLFQNIEVTPSHSIKVGDGKTLMVEGIGKSDSPAQAKERSQA